MDALPWLRVLHIVFGAYVVGSYLFSVLILEPRLRRLGPAIEGPVLKALLPIMAPVNTISFVALIGTGVWMTLVIRGSSLDTLLATGWGWAIAIKLAATVGILVIGFGLLMPMGMRMEKLSRAMEGRAPTLEEGRQLKRLSATLYRFGNVNFALVLAAFATVLLVRYV
jgi:hypothetical protein